MIASKEREGVRAAAEPGSSADERTSELHVPVIELRNGRATITARAFLPRACLPNAFLPNADARAQPLSAWGVWCRWLR